MPRGQSLSHGDYRGRMHVNTATSRVVPTPVTRMSRLVPQAASKTVRAAARSAVFIAKMVPSPSKPIDWMTERPMVEPLWLRRIPVGVKQISTVRARAVRTLGSSAERALWAAHGSREAARLEDSASA